MVPLRLIALIALLVLANFAGAGGARAQVSCSVNFTALAFGNVNVLPGAAADSAGSLTTSCTGITGTNRVLLCFRLNAGTYPYSG